MPNLTVLHVVDDYHSPFSACCKVFAVMSKLERPDFTRVVVELKNCLERKLASVTDVVCKQGGRSRWIVIKAFGDLILFDLSQQNSKAMLGDHSRRRYRS